MIATRPRRRFGQHFLHDRNLIAKIITAVAPAPGDRFVEIGPGEGALTAPLLARVGSLDAVEIDRDLAAALPERLGADSRLRVHCADALRFDFRTLARDGQMRLVGNLPYNISTPLLFHLLAQEGVFSDLHVMVQKEVGERMAAGPGSKTYGRLSIALATRCRVERLFAIAPGCFRPPPRVDSVFVRLTPAEAAAGRVYSRSALDRVLVTAFSMRRKRLGRGLRSLLPEPELRAVGIDPDLRPEDLDPAGYVRLANALAARQDSALAKAGTPSQNGPQP